MLLNKEYWKEVIQEIEDAAHQKTLKDLIKNYDLSVTLPEDLQQRVKKIMPYEFDEYDRLVYIAESAVETPKSFDIEESTEDELERRKVKKKAVFNESTCSEIERMENEFVKFEMKLDTGVERKAKAKKQINWTSGYICKPRRERVKWDSKIYHLERSLAEKTLDEQAECLMDASAERFTEWLNSVSNNRETDISKAQLKSLFSIEGDRRLLASIQTEPKEVKAIAKAVADKWNLPEMAIELKYENYIKDLLKNVPKKVIKVAFGRTVPYEERPWVPMDRDRLITTVFPDELLSGAKLFKGIGHLRSVKTLKEFYQQRPHLKRPKYLEKTGLFRKTKKLATKQEIPLYELLKLEY
ncbi:uncharacterized protein LOC105222017 [Bactrocera dorsalis]|uniref:Uncharacterized protein LOC105222017 n=1 Tax=Bactrocera dorsalis TaxID=27457 RepID=A0A6I9UTR9_BACDO|nr:uncharacterized protein LOC105222017 [Bactrocera dorsalis]